jgi:hypothetical protein
MSSPANYLQYRPGVFAWCAHLHEDELKWIGKVSRDKKGARAERVLRETGRQEQECVSVFEICGKSRPAVILRKFGERNEYLEVWFTCTVDEKESKKDNWVDVTDITPRRPGQKAFLKPRLSDIRRILTTKEWCGEFIADVDRTLLDSWRFMVSKMK